MPLTKTTGWSLGTTGLCVALAAGGWFGLVAPERADAAESRELTVAAEQSNMLLEAKIDELREQYANLPAEEAKLAMIRQALPAEAGLAQLNRDLDALSIDAGTTLEMVTAAAPVAVVDPAAAVAAPAPDEAAAEGAAPAPAPSAEPSAAPSAAADPAGAAAPPAVVTAPAQPVLAAVPITVTITGDFASSTLLLKGLQAQMPRAFLVDGLVLAIDEGESAEPGAIRTVVTGRVFVFQDPTATTSTAGGAEPSTSPSDG